MANIQLPPYLAGKELDENTLRELELWFSDMSALVNTGALASTDTVNPRFEAVEADITTVNTDVTNIAQMVTIPRVQSLPTTGLMAGQLVVLLTQDGNGNGPGVPVAAGVRAYTGTAWI